MFGKEEDKEKNDYFENSGPIEETPKEPKKPVYKPDDPAYWDSDESEWEHLKPQSRWRLWLAILLVVVVLGLVAGCWIRFFSPYVEDATQYGYIEHIEKRGTLFKTYEGIMIPYKDLLDTTRVYNRDFVFSVDNENTATQIKKAQFDARPVRVSYKQYHATVPWRGASKIVVTAVDSVDPSKILPPEFSPRP